jgi:hypothetical protein
MGISGTRTLGVVVFGLFPSPWGYHVLWLLMGMLPLKRCYDAFMGQDEAVGRGSAWRRRRWGKKRWPTSRFWYKSERKETVHFEGLVFIRIEGSNVALGHIGRGRGTWICGSGVRETMRNHA